MLEILAPIIFETCQLIPGKTVVVGVSGGADSLCLMDILLKAGLPIVVAHYNHHLRAEAEAEAHQVGLLAAQSKVFFELGGGDVHSFASHNKIPDEEAARILRYQFLFAQAVKYNAQAVAVAHHADDQAETVLMHLLRGTGLDGLVGMPARFLPNPWSSSIPLVRPLLSTWRSEIETYCREQGLQPSEDCSNQDISFTRNRIRRELLPEMEKYNPRFKRALVRLSKTLQADLDVLEHETEEAWRTCQILMGDGWVNFRLEQLKAQPLGLQRRLLRRAVNCLGCQDIDFEMVERGVLSLNLTPERRQLDLGKGLSLFWEGERIWLAAWEAELPGDDWPQVDLNQGESIPLAVPRRIILGKGWQLTTEELPGDIAWSLAQHNPDPYQAFIDASLQGEKLAIRVRLPGDTFSPLGLDAHTQKLSDFMINVKLPQRARRKWPLICAGRTVTWVPGYAISHIVRLQQGVKRAIHLRLY